MLVNQTMTSAQVNTSGKKPQYMVMADDGNLTDELSEEFRDLTPEEAHRFFGVRDRIVRVGVAE